MSEGTRSSDTVLGAALAGGTLAGVGGILLALLAAFTGSLQGAALALVASALAFGLLANALLRS